MTDEVPTLKLPKLATAALPPSKRKSPRKRPHRLREHLGHLHVNRVVSPTLMQLLILT